MKITTQAMVLDELKTIVVRKKLRPGIHLFLLGVAYVFAIGSYLGLFCATAFCLLVPFDLLIAMNIKPPSDYYWILAFIIMACELGIICFLGSLLGREFCCYRRINIELTATCAGVATTILLIARLYFAGIIPFE